MTVDTREAQCLKEVAAGRKRLKQACILIGPDFETGPGLISMGTTITRSHDVDKLHQANNTWLLDYLPDPLHVHMAAT